MPHSVKHVNTFIPRVSTSPSVSYSSRALSSRYEVLVSKPVPRCYKHREHSTMTMTTAFGDKVNRLGAAHVKQLLICDVKSGKAVTW